MDKLEVIGKPPASPGTGLVGRIPVRGAKNAALPIQCAALLADGKTRLRHVPRLTDVSTMNKLLRELGCEVSADVDERVVEIDPTGVGSGSLEAPYEHVKTMRASVTVMGPLLGRYGQARVSLPGGCAIGARPIDQHLKGLEALGGEVTLEHGYVDVRAKASHGRLEGGRFHFDKVTVGGTQNVMMAAVLAKGSSRLENVAREPEVQELAVLLNKMGAQISGAGTDAIEIEGVDRLEGIDHAILADRIEAGTFAVAAAITRGDVLLEHAPVDHMRAVIDKLIEAGVECRVEAEGLRVIGPERIRPIDVATRPHPGFPTDMQAQIMVLACMADGASVIRETIFENRFMHVPELNRLGADIVVNGNTAVVRGPTRFSGTTVMATDLRASASLVLAGLVAEGATEVRRVYHLDRGYEAIEARLSPLGAQIARYHGAGA
ncbi:UDP-N-acetylglucosamine 1-carboxyvinyltransferase [Plesiocystis pacifica SIR-1]|uniref:UDP-N-acetylglucosamine 1-carboxyvinyltransferase n=1 Tax=Plesiocystis pacifica SIR-1 TaxID=391625 RepID=A6GG69_9BACT|nr:UDP-N-acetylglucosamine 1-carboxyvinyltransferase [Plesiocystis pacifica]EDM75138.1 UDP-N-acetylglucosamine 1-carboxyvinyltransferase [Plesiocystis pacifica SIR-1]